MSKHFYIILLTSIFICSKTVKGQVIDFYEKFETKLTKPIKNIVLSQNGKYFAASSGTDINIYDLSNKKLLKSINTNNNQEISELYFLPNDSLLFISHQNLHFRQIFNKPDKESFILNWLTSKKNEPIYNSKPVFFRDKQKYLGIANEYQEIKSPGTSYSTRAPLKSFLIHFTKEGKAKKVISKPFEEIINDVLSEDSRFLATSYHNGYILISDPNSLKTLDSIPSKSNLNPAVDLKFSHDGNFLAYSDMHRKKITVYDVINKKIHFSFKPLDENDDISAFSFGDNNLFALSHRNFLKIFDLNNNKKVFEKNTFNFLDQPIDLIKSLVFISDTNQLLLGGFVYKNSTNGNPRDRLPRLIVFEYEKYQKLIKEINYQDKPVLPRKKNQSYVTSQIWHPYSIGGPKILFSDKYLLSFSEKNIKLWNVNTLRKINNYNLSDDILNIVCSKDGKYIIARTRMSGELKLINTYKNEISTLSKSDPINFELDQNSAVSIYNSRYLVIYTKFNGGYIYDLDNSKFFNRFDFDFDFLSVLPRAIMYKDKLCNFIINEHNKLIIYDPFKKEILLSKNLVHPLQYLKLNNESKIIGYNYNDEIIVFNLEKLKFEPIYKFSNTRVIKNIDLVNENGIFMHYSDKNDDDYLSFLLANKKEENILDSSIYIENSGILNESSYYKTGNGKISFYDIDVNVPFQNIQYLNQDKNVSLRNELLLVGKNIVDLKKCEIKKSFEFNKSYFFKDSLFITSHDLIYSNKKNRKMISCLDVNGNTLQKAEVTIRNSNLSINDTKISPNDRYAISIGLFNDFIIWDLENFKFLKEERANISGKRFCWNHNGNKFLFVDQDKKTFNYNLRIYNIENKRFEKIFSPKLSNTDQISATNNDSIILYGYRFIQKFNILKNKTYGDYFFHPYRVSKMIYNADKDYLITGLSNGEIFVWSYTEKKLISRLWKHNDEIIDLFIDNNRLVSSSKDESICIWDLKENKLLTQYYQFENDLKTEYCFITKDNYYKASKSISEFIHFVQGNKTYPFEQFDLKYNRPDITLEKIGMSDSTLINSYKNAYYKRLKKMNFEESMLSEKWHAPEIKIKNLKSIYGKFGRITNSPNIELELEASDSLYLLNRLNIWVNNVPIYGVNGISLVSDKTNNLSRMIKLELSEGSNKIQASVINQNGAESNKETINIKYQPVKSKKPNLYIAGIGVSEYANFNNLKNVDNDIRGLVGLYKCEKSDYFNKIYVDTIINSKAKKEQLPRLKKFLQQSDVNDVVIVYYSGHGNFSKDKKNYYLFTHDIDAKNISDKGILYESIEDLIDNIPARKKLLLINACKSGEYDEDLKTLEITNALFSDLRRKSGAMIISSSSSDQFSFTGSEKYKDFSAFGYSLINLLKQNKILTVNDLQSKLSKDVSLLTKNKQKPSFRGINLEMDFRFW